jgi:hypothetical protein
MSDVNFSIAYPEITWDALTVEASEDSNFPVRNLFYGGSGSTWKRSGTATSTNITFDLGVSKTSTANYCILRGINNIVAQQGDRYGVSVEVRASTDNFATNVLIVSQDPIELVGVKDEDAILLFDTSAAYRYWRVVIKTNTAIQHQLRKLFIGNLFDFNSNSPYYPYRSNYVPTAEPFVSDRGTLFKSSNGRKQKLIEINWRNVLDSTRDFFQARIIEAKDDSPICVVHKDSIHNPLTVYKKPKTLADFKPVAAFLAKPERMFDAVSGGSLPAYGGQVARWENAFGSNHATQATPGARPIRSTAPITGVRNLLNRSEEFENAYWTKTRSTVSANATVAPDGTLTADKLEETVDTSTKSARPSNNLTVPTGGDYIISFDLKASERTFAVVMDSVSNRGKFFNLTNGDVGANFGVGAPPASGSEFIGDGWYRCWIRVNVTGTTIRPNVLIALADGTSDYLGVEGSGVFVWGARLEQGSSLTPYQRRVNRHEVYEQGVPNRDYLFFDGSNDFMAADGLASVFHGDDTPFTFVAIARPLIDISSGVLASYGTSTSGDFRGEFSLTSSGDSRLLSAFRKDSAAEVSTFSLTPYTNEQSGIFTKVFKGQSVDFVYNGTFVLNNGSLNKDTLGTNPNRFAIGARSYSSTDLFFQGDYYALLVFNKALTNADRQYVESLLSEEFSVSNIQAPENIKPNLLTAWVREYDISTGENANLNNVNLSLVEDII